MGLIRRGTNADVTLNDGAGFKPRSRDILTLGKGEGDQHLLVEETALSKHTKSDIDRHFAWFETKLPRRPAAFMRWLRKPSSRLVRIPLALLLVIGGVFGFLPVLGLWMLPLGLLLIAQDVPVLQGPLAAMLGWIDRKWMERRRAGDAR